MTIITGFDATDFLAPGMLFSFRTDILGPFPVGSFWSYGFFTGPLNEIPVVQGTKQTTGSTGNGVIGSSFEGWDVILPRAAYQEGTDGNFEISLVDDRQQEIDFFSQAMRWSPTAAVTAHASSIASAGGGLTTAQAAQLTQVVTNTTALTPVQQALGNLFNIPPIDQWLSPASTIFLQGTGRIATGSIGPISTAIGMWIDSVDFPPELGHTQGFMLSFVDRIAQLVAIRASSDFPPELFLSIFDLHTEKALWLWNDIRVEHVGYSVLPGCAVHGRWVTAGLGPR